MTWTSAIGFLAGCVTVVSFLPQVYRVWTTRRTRDLSLGAFALLASGAALWLTYGLLLGDGPMIVTNAAVGILVASIITAKLRFDRADEPPRPGGRGALPGPPSPEHVRPRAEDFP